VRQHGDYDLSPWRSPYRGVRLCFALFRVEFSSRDQPDIAGRIEILLEPKFPPRAN
jgi:hypothetical protein